jgi:hypothetical protein
MKQHLPNDPTSAEGDLHPLARLAVDRFVQDIFASACGGMANVLWFRNWTTLKSVHAVEHVHVLLLDPPEDFLRDITNGDVAWRDRVMNGEVRLD